MQNPAGISSDDEILIFLWHPSFWWKKSRVTRRTPATWAHFSTVVRSTLRLQVSRFYCDKDRSLVIREFFAKLIYHTPPLFCSNAMHCNLWICGGFKYFSFSSLPGEMIQFDKHIFQMGCFNHQPEYIQVVWTQLFLGFAMFVARNVSTRLRKKKHTPFLCTGRFHYVGTGGWTVGFFPYAMIPIASRYGIVFCHLP